MRNEIRFYVGWNFIDPKGRECSLLRDIIVDGMTSDIARQ